MGSLAARRRGSEARSDICLNHACTCPVDYVFLRCFLIPLVESVFFYQTNILAHKVPRLSVALFLFVLMSIINI